MSQCLCGDGKIDPGEQCDGDDVGSATCSSVTGNPKLKGYLLCGGCQYDTTYCQCGDGVLNGNEQCDGNQFAPGLDCEPGDVGLPSCTPECIVDFSPCQP